MNIEEAYEEHGLEFVKMYYELKLAAKDKHIIELEALIDNNIASRQKHTSEDEFS